MNQQVQNLREFFKKLRKEISIIKLLFKALNYISMPEMIYTIKVLFGQDPCLSALHAVAQMF